MFSLKDILIAHNFDILWKFYMNKLQLHSNLCLCFDIFFVFKHIIESNNENMTNIYITSLQS